MFGLHYVQNDKRWNIIGAAAASSTQHAAIPDASIADWKPRVTVATTDKRAHELSGLPDEELAIREGEVG
jgi:hypothetical protein